MFITDNEIVEQLNLIYGGSHSTGGTQFVLPEKELILSLLKSKSIIDFFYLKPIKMVPGDADKMAEISISLENFFAYPFGDKLWVNDPAFKLLATDNFVVPQEICNKVLNTKFNTFKSKEPYKSDNWGDFIEHLNKLYSPKVAS